jgi:inorganic pyrophosphatase
LVKVRDDEEGTSESLLEAGTGSDASVAAKVADIQDAISDGAVGFLMTEYKYIFGFMSVFSVVIFVLLGSQDGFQTKYTTDKDGRPVAPGLFVATFSTLSFILGAGTSSLSGSLGMKIATYANGRTALEARKGVAPGFMTAFRSGAVMGFLLSGLGLLILFLTVVSFKLFYFKDDWAGLYEVITGYGLGGSTIALFGRVGGGIYTKAADVGADLVGKVEKDIPEDDPRNPAVIADNVGDNVGDIAGMGADLFGSFAESTCAALVVSSLSSLGAGRCIDGNCIDGNKNWAAMNYPLMLTGCGIVVCFFTTLIATDISPARNISQIEPTLKRQLQVSTVLMLVVVFGITFGTLPHKFELYMPDNSIKTVYNWQMYVSVALGLISGYLIGHMTEIYTSNRYKPVIDVADSCKTGAATNIIFGLALGYQSCIVPSFCLAVTIYFSYACSGMYGIACSALGMLGTLATGLAIDAYGPISDNAGGIAEMAEMGEEIRERTDALDAAGNTTAAVGKGFAIGSAALVSLALFGAYVTRADLDFANCSILDKKVFPGLLIGAMLPFWFSAMTMKSVGRAALAMVEEVRRQFNTIPGLMEGTGKPDYKKCIEISTQASLAEMGPPGALVIFTPLIVGTLFGVNCLAGVLVGALISGVQMAISASNTGGAWDNAKKYLEAGRSEHARMLGGKGTEAHKAAVIGDTVGDPLKDTSGPALNILIKLMAVESLVFAPFFAAHTRDGLLFQFFGN